MTKLELTVSASSLNVIRCEEKTANILKINVEEQGNNISSVLANAEELELFETAIRGLKEEWKGHEGESSPFSTLSLVFSAPNAPDDALKSDRRPIDGVFRSPLRAIHGCGELELACFTHLTLSKGGEEIIITALEYSRKHRSRLLRQEFGSWLLEEHIEKAVIATTLTGEICFWNRFCTELYQWTHEEAMGANIMDRTPSEMTQEQGMEIMAQLGKGEHWTGMFRVRRKDNSDFMAHVVDTPILDQNGAVKFIVGVSADYSQLHDMMQELETLNMNLEKEVQDRTEQLLEHSYFLRMVGAAVKESDTGILITEENLRVVWLNDAVFRMLPCDEEDLLGTFAWDLPLAIENTPQNVGDLTLRQFLELVQEGQTASITATVAQDKEEWAPSPVEVLSVSVQAMSSSLQDQDQDQGHQYMITLRDLTAERKADEAQLAAEKAAAASEMKTEMMQMLSHELRTPLQGIMGVASTILEDVGPEQGIMFDSLSTILASSRLLLTLINNVLDIRKMDANMMQQIDLSPVRVDQCVQDSIKFCDPFAALSETRLVYEVEAEGDASRWTAMGNRLRLQQVLVNLLSNAIKYTTAVDTDILVSIRHCSAQEALREAREAASSDLRLLSSTETEELDETSGNVVVVSVRDHGKGVPSEECWKLFGEFMQLDISAAKDRQYKGDNAISAGQSSGSGLGLNLAMKFVTRMNGHIWFNNCDSDGGGAKFSLYLPACEASIDDTEGETRAKEAAELSVEDAARFRVLVVDDSKINLKVLSRMLVRLGVKQVHTAVNGIEGLKCLTELDKDSQPNLILADLQMPEMDGFELMGEIRNLHVETVPICMACSADWTTEVETKCMEVGFDGILRKPITFSDLKRFLATSQVVSSHE